MSLDGKILKGFLTGQYKNKTRKYPKSCIIKQVINAGFKVRNFKIPWKREPL